MIGNAETGHNRTLSIVLGFKEALLEEAEKKKQKQRLHCHYYYYYYYFFREGSEALSRLGNVVCIV